MVRLWAGSDFSALITCNNVGEMNISSFCLFDIVVDFPLN